MRGLLLFAAALICTTPATAQQLDAPLGAERQQESRTSILAATQAPDFDNHMMRLDVYRTLKAAGVTLSSAEAFEMGERARALGLPAEALEAYSLMSDDEYGRIEFLVQTVRKAAEPDSANEIENAVEYARQGKDDRDTIAAAELVAGLGYHEQAIELLRLALRSIQQENDDPEARAAEASRRYDRSIEFYRLEFREHPCGWSGSRPLRLCASEVALAQLKVGISLFELKRVEEARATWSAITGSPAVEILAKAWIDIANKPAN